MAPPKFSETPVTMVPFEFTATPVATLHQQFFLTSQSIIKSADGITLPKYIDIDKHRYLGFICNKVTPLYFGLVGEAETIARETVTREMRKKQQIVHTKLTVGASL